MFIRCLPPSF